MIFRTTEKTTGYVNVTIDQWRY